MPTIFGRVMNSFTGQGIPASIQVGGLLINADGSGNFLVAVASGSYQITAHYVGYSPGSAFAIVQTSDVSVSISMVPIFQAL